MPSKTMTPKEAIALARAKEVKVVDLRFADISGRWHHFTIPVVELSEDLFEQGLAIDLGGPPAPTPLDRAPLWVLPDPSTAFIDPFVELSTLTLLCGLNDRAPLAPSDYCTRSIAARAMRYLASSGHADEARLAAKPQFHLFNDVRYRTSEQEAYYRIDSQEGAWNSDADEYPNTGYKFPAEGGQLAVPPMDKGMDIRNAMVLTMMEIGLVVDCQHHGRAAGQGEINLRGRDLLEAADDLLKFKYAVRNVADRHGQSATFMPRPHLGGNGSGMSLALSLWQEGRPLFAGGAESGLSETAWHFLGGVLQHAPALCALTNPTTNSYKRLGASEHQPTLRRACEHSAPAACRLPAADTPPGERDLEFRFPDPSANPYLAASALLQAGLDGINNRVDPTPYQQEASNSERLPGSLMGAVRALADDYTFLLQGDVFSESFILHYLNLKQAESEAMRAHPHPLEFELYYDS